MFSKGPTKNALPIPTTVLDDPKAGEILRAWAAHKGLHVGLAPRALGDDPSVWGIVLVDIARHISRAFKTELNLDPEATMSRIRALFEAEWDRPTDLGTTKADRKN